jgi:hypothetical protein
LIINKNEGINETNTKNFASKIEDEGDSDLSSNESESG